jgi:methylenetetrahydrofolate dehydrogenase (NADP+)/methenyltetrahydrofolate cyclohydrolase
MVTFVDGKKMSKTLQQEMKEFISHKDMIPSLHIIYIGSDPVIDSFVKYKQAFGAEINAEVVVHNLDGTITQQEALTYIHEHTKDADGIIVQLPLPKHFDRNAILDAVPCAKDIDVLSEKTRILFSENNTPFFPPVTGAIVHIAKKYSIDFSSSKTLIIGDGMLVGHPTVLWMNREKYDYTLVNKETDMHVLHQLMHESDIIISGAGQPHMIKEFFIKQGVILFDAGTSESGKKILGDVNPSAYEKARLVTPVPGGIGPLTIAMLYYNLLHASYLDYDRDINTIT